MAGTRGTKRNIRVNTPNVGQANAEEFTYP